MLNQYVVVGRLVKDIEVKSVGEKQLVNITIAVPRSYKNSEGEYDTDFIPIVLWGAIATNTAEYCRKGDLLGIKGRLETDTKGNISVIAEKITFLSSKKKDE